MRRLVLAGAGALFALIPPTAAAAPDGGHGQAQLAQSKLVTTGVGLGGATAETTRSATTRSTATRGGLGRSTATSQVLAQGQGGALTVDAVMAYIEALEFSLAQVGQTTRFPQAARADIAQRLAQAYPSIPLVTQRNLAEARAVWTQYARAWGSLTLAQEQEFVFHVLAIYGGKEAAAQALGLNAGDGAGSGASTDGSYGESYHIDPNYEGSDCWASAGCAGYTPEGGYVYEDYNPTTDTYDINQ
jgi:hypothetical protein